MQNLVRIQQLLMELEKEIEQIPDEVENMKKKESEYDTVNSEVYHTVLNFNPSASEASTFIKRWQGVLQERHLHKKELRKVFDVMPQLTEIQELIPKILSVIEGKNDRQRPFVYKTEIGSNLIKDSFKNFEERVNYPTQFLESHMQSDTATLELNDASNISCLNVSPPDNSNSLFLESYQNKLYLLNGDGIFAVKSTWSDMYQYMNKFQVKNVFIEIEMRETYHAEIIKTYNRLKTGNPMRKPLKNLLSNNVTTRSNKRQQRIRRFEEELQSRKYKEKSS